jgi:Arc/MetJ-type ribon-helix-helix transcriptional regulator
MQVHLTPDQRAFARRAIENGRIGSEEDAVQEALALWEERERERAEFLLTLDDARASLERGEGRVITQEAMRQLASEVKERGRAGFLLNWPRLANGLSRSPTRRSRSRRHLVIHRDRAAASRLPIA